MDSPITLFSVVGDKVASSSTLEALLNRSSLPISMIERFYNPFFDHETPNLILLSMLPTPDRLNLRLVSHKTLDWINGALSDTFSTLYIDPATRHFENDEASKGLHRIGGYCREAVVRLSHNSPSKVLARGTSEVKEPVSQPEPSLELIGEQSSHVSLKSHSAEAKTTSFNHTSSQSQISPVDVPYWRTILQQTHNIQIFTISLPGEPGWCGLRHTERILLAIRQALESVSLPLLHSFKLVPIHIMGLLHLRWAGGTAFGSSDWMAGRLWTQIKKLEVWLTNPAKTMSRKQQNMGIKVLHDYLTSFCPTVEELKWCWVGQYGPNVMFLEDAVAERHEVGKFSQPLLVWKKLHTATLLDCDVSEEQVSKMFGERAPNLQNLIAEGDFEERKGVFQEHLKNFGVQFTPVVGNGLASPCHFWKEPEYIYDDGEQDDLDSLKWLEGSAHNKENDHISEQLDDTVLVEVGMSNDR
ncbi:MAG: hypothetical protein M1837_000218 [Sclerophora amabilis]|nr:MAG: hypothetical protein M1837_000218 [Sclerophora amabilis]